MSDVSAPAAAPAAPAESSAPSTEVNTEAVSDDSSVDEGDIEGEDAVEEAPKPEKKTWKFKAAGKDVTFDSEEELVKHAQMGLSAQEKWQEAAQIRKEMQEFASLLQNNTAEALSLMGLDVDKLAEDHIARRIEEMQKSPEQLEREKIQKELEGLKKEKEDLRTKAEKAEMDRLQEQYATQIETEMTEALNASKTLPKSPYVVKRIADMMLLAHDNGKTDVTVNDVLPLVEKDIRSEIQQMFAAMPEELVEAVIGKETFNKVRRKRLSRSKPAPATASGIKQTGVDSKSVDKPKERLSAKDFFKKIGTL